MEMRLMGLDGELTAAMKAWSPATGCGTTGRLGERGDWLTDTAAARRRRT